MKLSAKLLQQYLRDCGQQKKLSPKTIKAYRIDLRQFIEFQAELGKSFDRETIKAYLARLNQEYKPRTVKRKIASLRAFSTWLCEERLLKTNPFSGLRLKIQEPLLLPKTIPLRVIKRMLEAVYGDLRSERAGHGQRLRSLRDAAVIELLFATGMRVSEICSMKTRDVDLIDGEIRICGKGAKERIIQLTNIEVITILRQYAAAFRQTEESPFLQNGQGKRLSEASIRRIVRKYAKIIGVTTRVIPHMFRHSLATLLLEENVDLRYIQQLLGHSSIVTTQIYTHVTSAKQRDILTNSHPRNKFTI